MSNNVVIYGEQHRNFPSEQVGVLVAGSLFFSRSIKFQLEKLANVSDCSSDGQLPLLSVDGRLYSGLDTAMGLADEAACRPSNQGDQGALQSGQSLGERVQRHRDSLALGAAGALLHEALVHAQWLQGGARGPGEALMGERHAWPLNRLLCRHLIQRVHSYARFAPLGLLLPLHPLDNDSGELLLGEWERFCAHQAARISREAQHCQAPPPVAELDLLMHGYLAVMRASALFSFARLLEIADRYPAIGQLEARVEASLVAAAGTAYTAFRDEILGN